MPVLLINCQGNAKALQEIAGNCHPKSAQFIHTTTTSSYTALIFVVRLAYVPSNFLFSVCVLHKRNGWRNDEEKE